MDYQNRPRINTLSERDMALLLKDNFLKIGIKSPTDEGEIRIMLHGMFKYQGYCFIEDFENAFDEYAADIFELTMRPGYNSRFVSVLLKAYKEKHFGKKSREQKQVEEWQPSPDEGYYNSLICVMEGRKSERFEQFYPKSKPAPGNQIPMTWDWWAVYRHLLTLKEVLPTENKVEQNKLVMLWLYSKYPNAVTQESVFNSSPLMQMASKIQKGKREFIYYS